MKLTIKEEEAKFAHQKYYSGNFEVIEIKRSGIFDFPPFSFVYGISDLGSWDGLMSTDGSKFVVTKSAFLDIGKVKEVFEFERKDLTSVKKGVFKTTLSFQSRIKKLTRLPSIVFLILLAIACIPPCIGAVLFFVFKGKIFQFRPSNTFNNIEKFDALLKG
jgi:hypothetical protein